VPEMDVGGMNEAKSHGKLARGSLDQFP